MESSIQVKVEYGPEKWVNFFVAISKISSGGYTFVNLVDDIVQRCPAISHLNSANIRIRYQDDEGSYINLIFGDEYGFRDMWDNAKNVPDREYRRIKIKACEIDSPCTVRSNVQSTSAATVTRKQVEKPNVKKPRQLYSTPEKDDYEYLSDERKKKIKSYSDQSKAESRDGSSKSDSIVGTYGLIKTPVERLFDNLEGDISKISRQIESKEAELQCFNDSVKTALIRNDGTLPVCGQCHLREGHTKRNCKLGVCLSVKSCGLIDKHPNEKGERRKMESELATLRKNLNKSQENFRMKKKAYSKVNESFVCKVEQDLILSNPDVYVQNGCKNWSLIHKHSAILEQKCKGKLPKRNDIPKLLKSATGDCNKIFDSSDSSDEENFHGIEPEKSTSANPAKETLQNHGIIFPENKSANFNSVGASSTSPKTASSQLYRCAPLNPQEEQEQLNIVLNQSILEQCGVCKVPVDNMPMSSMMPFNYQYLPSPNFAFYPTNFQFIRAPFNPQTTDVIHLQTESENTRQNMQVKCQLQLQSESENNCHSVQELLQLRSESENTPAPLPADQSTESVVAGSEISSAGETTSAREEETDTAETLVSLMGIY